MAMGTRSRCREAEMLVEGEGRETVTEDGSVDNENSLVIKMLQEIQGTVREIQVEQNTAREAISSVVEENRDLAERLMVIEAKGVTEQLEVADLRSRFDALEQRVRELSAKFKVVLDEMSRTTVELNELKSYRAAEYKEYQAQFCDSFESLLTVVEGLERQLQIIQKEVKRGRSFANMHTEQREQRSQPTVKDMDEYDNGPLLERRLKYEQQSEPKQPEFKERRSARKKPIQLPPKFDGKSSWEAFLAQFEITARMNLWADEDKAAFLATSLVGNATLVLSNLSEGDCRNYEALVAALTSRFGVTHQSDLARAKLKNRLKRRDETLPELVEAVETLTRTAYPDAPPSLQDVLGRDHFIDALTDEDLRLRVRQTKPQSLQAALETALELESFQLANRHRNRLLRDSVGHVRIIEEDSRTPAMNSTSNKQENHGNDKLQRLEGVINELIKELRRQSRRQRRPRSPANNGRSPTRSGDSKCWDCGEIGHFARNCKEKSRADENKSPEEGDGFRKTKDSGSGNERRSTWRDEDRPRLEQKQSRVAKQK